MYDPGELAMKCIRDFFFGTGTEPSDEAYRKAMERVVPEAADSIEVNAAHRAWIQYYSDLQASLPLHRRILNSINLPPSSQDSMLGFIAFVVDRGIHFADNPVVEEDGRSGLAKAKRIIKAVRNNRANRRRDCGRCGCR